MLGEMKKHKKHLMKTKKNLFYGHHLHLIINSQLFGVFELTTPVIIYLLLWLINLSYYLSMSKDYLSNLRVRIELIWSQEWQLNFSK